MTTDPATRVPRVAIIGAGMSGICMAVKLKQAGVDDFRIYEKADRLGGTWRDNTYPGLHCDIPSRLYQYSFALNPDWTQFFSGGAEIWSYFDRVADEYDVRGHISFGTEISEARYADGRWHLRTADGDEDTADFLIAATGILHHPRYPDIEGLDTFAGDMFHSARWDHDVPLEGRRIAVLGTGSTGIQIVTALAGTAGRLKMFQRTAQWIVPVPNPSTSAALRAAYRHVPGLQQASYRGMERVFGHLTQAVVRDGWQRRLINWTVRRNLATVRDPELRRKLTPDYEPMCKRLVLSPSFYSAIQRDNVDLVTDAIYRIEPDGLRTRDGLLHEVDVLVLATGFDAHAYVRPIELIGEGGRTLSAAWRDGPRAYQTVALPGFPNCFLLMGPHSPIGNFPLTAIAESQAGYVLRWIERWRAGEFTAAAPTRQATDRFNRRMRAAAPTTIWASGCTSWYLDKDGVPELWPWHPGKHRKMLRTIEDGDFELTGGRATHRGPRSLAPMKLAALGVRLASVFVLSPALPVSAQRRMCDLAGAGRLPRDVSVARAGLGGRTALRVEPAGADPAKAVLLLHGGGYNIGSPRSHRALAAHLAAGAGAPVYVLDYRLAPEHPHPAALDDAVAAYRALRESGAQVSVAGDSAGGGLALALAMRLREEGTELPAALALISPWADLSTGSSGSSGRDLLLRSSSLRAWAHRYGAGDLQEPAVSPLYGDLTGLPPTLIHVSAGEILEPDVHRLAERLRAAGVAVRCRTIPNAWHDVHLHAGWLAPAGEAVRELGSFLADPRAAARERQSRC